MEQKKRYDLLASSVPEFGTNHTFKEYAETYAAVLSRTFDLKIDPNDKKRTVNTMVPFADLMNHNEPRPCIRWVWHKDEMTGQTGWLGKAYEEVKKGDQVFGSYGLRSNQALLQTYGFTFATNEEEVEFALKINLEETEPDLLELKQQIIGGLKFSHTMKSQPTATDMSLFRVLFFDDGDNAEQLEDYIGLFED